MEGLASSRSANGESLVSSEDFANLYNGIFKLIDSIEDYVLMLIQDQVESKQ